MHFILAAVINAENCLIFHSKDIKWTDICTTTSSSKQNANNRDLMRDIFGAQSEFPDLKLPESCTEVFFNPQIRCNFPEFQTVPRELEFVRRRVKRSISTFGLKVQIISKSKRAFLTAKMIVFVQDGRFSTL